MFNKAQAAARDIEQEIDEIAAELVSEGMPLWAAIAEARKQVQRNRAHRRSWFSTEEATNESKN